MSWPFDSPDSLSGGVWTGREGTTDWCEENYVYSRYVAEPLNTVSNAGYIVLALYGLRHARAQRLPARFSLCNLSLLCVGLGSVAYHATLRSWAQALDELPMMGTVGVVTYAVLDTAPRKWPHLLPAILLAAYAAWLAAYAQIASALFHEIGFAALVLLTALRVLFLLHHTPHARARTLYLQGLAVFLSGFAAWALENQHCAALRAARVPVLGHAYWHAATAVGAYRMIVATELLVLAATRRPGRFWADGALFPVVRWARDAGA